MWTFDYRTFWNPGVDSIKVWYGDTVVGALHTEAAARELQARLQGFYLGPGDADPPPASVPLPAWPPAQPADPSLSDIPNPVAVATPAPPVDPPDDLPELIRVTCEGPLKNAICRVLGYQDGCYRVVVLSDGKYRDSETAVSPENCVPHTPQWP